MDQKTKRIITLAIIALNVIAFYPVLNADFVNYDDPEYVLNNPFIKHFSLENIKSIFLIKTTDLYVPITILSYLVEHSVFGANPKTFHFFNLVIHIINTLLLINILTKLNIKSIYLICFVILFFSINPLITESVCWITERKDVLYCLFYFLSIIQFLKYITQKHIKHLLLCFLFFILSCLSKPMAVSLPLMISLYILYHTQKHESLTTQLKRFLFLIPFFIVSLLTSVLSINSLSKLGTVKASITNYTIFEKTALIFSEVGYYFIKPIVPFSQSLFHFFPEKERLFSPNIFPFMLIGLFLAGFFSYLFFVKNNKLIGYLFLSWLIFLLPVLQIYSNTHSYVSERYFYVSIMFPVIITFLILEKVKLKDTTYKFSLGLITLLFMILTFKRSAVWKNSRTLFEAELKIDPDNSMALNNLGYYYNTNSEFYKALPLLKKAVEKDNTNAFNLNNYGWALAATGEIDNAILYLEKAIQINPSYTEALNNIGICYMKKQDPEKASRHFIQAYNVAPDNPDVLFNLGLYYYNSGKKEEGLPLLKKAYQFGNTKALKYLNR